MGIYRLLWPLAVPSTLVGLEHVSVVFRFRLHRNHVARTWVDLESFHWRGIWKHFCRIADFYCLQNYSCPRRRKPRGNPDWFLINVHLKIVMLARYQIRHQKVRGHFSIQPTWTEWCGAPGPTVGQRWWIDAGYSPANQSRHVQLVSLLLSGSLSAARFIWEKIGTCFIAV